MKYLSQEKILLEIGDWSDDVIIELSDISSSGFEGTAVDWIENLNLSFFF